MKILYFLIIGLIVASCTQNNVVSYKQDKNGVIVSTTDGTLGIYPVADNAVRIKFVKDTLKSLQELVFTSKVPVPDFDVSETSSALEIKAKNVHVIVDKKTGKLSYADPSGKIFLSELAGTRKLQADSIQNEKCYLAEQSFDSPDDESIFGLGQFQDGHYNLKNVTRKLTQVNSQIAIPFIYSSKGYGLLWHQYGLTDFNPADNFIELTKQEANAGENQVVEVTTTSGSQRVSRRQALYTGKFSLEKDGEYSMMLDFGDMESRHFLVIDDSVRIDISNQWLPSTVSTIVKLNSGEHNVQVVCKSSNTPKLSWRLANNATTFRSPNAKELDYVVFYGPSADDVIASYRKLSGEAPMLPKWAYGFWQCRERYTSGKNLVETVAEFRKRNIPMDVIVQDWQYWGDNGWGVPVFDKTNYANPSKFIKQIHDLNAHLTVSIWSNPDKNSEIGKDFVAKNLFIPNTKWLDYFNPETRKEYWDVLKINMFDNGVDAWWMDAVEPENDALKGEMTYAGPGDFYRLTYPLMVSKAVYEGQRETSSDKRVCILTRSAFSGQQRYGVINWSGDIGSDWDTYKRQIVAGLNYTITGLPYWTTDIGGFFRPGRTQYTDEKYHEVLTRWYQWGAFNPVFRIHGYGTETEPWKYGETVEDNMKKMLDLRYRLLPYIYSEAWQVTDNGSTIMRPLVMDFREDNTAVDQAYEFMFGKSFLVAPVTEAGVSDWDVYLPKNIDWYNFWTGKKVNGGQNIKTDAPLDKIPLFVKAGSIVPMGDIIQYADENPNEPLEIRLYEGANGTFILYEDENDNYDYEQGKYSTITFTWNDTNKTLTISDRNGSFPGMVAERKFNIVRVTDENGAGTEVAKKMDKEINYTGKEVTVSL